MCCCPYAARPAPLEPFTRALGAGTVPIEITTDRALVFPAVLDELAPRARHGLCGKPTTSWKPTVVGSKQASVRLREFKRMRSACTIAAGHAFVQNLRRGHYEVITYKPA
jgi:IS6 family transposase